MDGQIRLKYHGHACFQLTKDAVSLIVDPFLAGNNPLAQTKATEIKCQYVLVTHGHFDHMIDAPAIVDCNQATLIATPEVAQEVGKACAEGVLIENPAIGGKKAFEFGFIRVTPAFHGSGVPGGHASGFIVNFYGQVVYFAGDTCLFGDMQLLGRLEKIDYAVIPIGDYFTMGPEDAALAVEFLKPRAVIPMHYNTWPPIEQDSMAFKKLVEEKTGVPVLVMEPNTEISLG